MVLSSTSKVPVIVQILPALNHGGVERGTLEVAAAIQARGWKSVVISSGGVLEAQLRRLGATHHTLPVHKKNPLVWGGVRRKLRRILKEEGASLVHVRSRVPAWIGLPVADRLGVPTISTIHGKFVPGNPFKRFYNRKMLRADRVIAISAFTWSTIQSHYEIATLAKRTHIIHRGVDMDQFNPEKVAQSRIVNEAERIGLSADHPVVMLPGRPTAWKGHEILLRALGHLKDLTFSTVLLGAADGSDDYVSKLEKLALASGLAGRVHIVKATRDVPAALMLADIVAMPSIDPEPFGRVAIEAQAMGRPVVAFNHGGAAESIIDGETGWLVPPLDEVALAEAIRAGLAFDFKTRKSRAEKARAHVETHFSTAKMCAATLDVYADLLK